MKATPSQKKQMHVLIKEIVALRDGDKCRRCGKPEWQMSHIYPKGRYKRMEFESLNIKPLCFSCHLHWWHKDPLSAKDWFESSFGKDRLQKLKLMANTDMGKFDPKLQILLLKSELESLKKR